jgi:hypothetical protein
VFSTQSTKDSLKRMPDGDLDSQSVKKQFRSNSSEEPVRGEYRGSHSDSYS